MRYSFEDKGREGPLAIIEFLNLLGTNPVIPNMSNIFFVPLRHER
jgi:hypothetical protein